ncbi:MAG: oligosaccharide flippase family protein [Gemmatimonadota bacterium]|nr:oligosaccharide flippase family protein [Gemmatimonadota bacterium]
MRLTKPRLDLVVAFGSQAGYKFLGFLVLAMLARALTHADYGLLMFSISLAMLAASLTDLGISQDLVRRAAADPDGALRRAGTVLSARMPLLATYVVVVNVWVALTKPDAWPVVAAVSVYGIGLEINRTICALFVGLRRITESVRVFSPGLLTLVLVIALGSALDAGLPWMVGAYVLAGLVLGPRAIHMANSRVGALRIRWRTRNLSKLFAGALPLFAMTMMAVLYIYADTLMVGYLRSYDEVAKYEAAARLFEASQFLIRPFVLILFPICAQLAAREDWGQLRRTLRLSLAGAAGLGIAACIGIGLLADAVIRVVYTSTFAESAAVLRVLFVAAPSLYLATVGMFMAASLHLDRIAMFAVAAGVGLNIVLNAMWIPDHGALGAAWSTVASLSFSALALGVMAFWFAHHPPITGAEAEAQEAEVVVP